MSALLNHLLTHLKFSKEYNNDNVSFRIFTQLSFGIFVSCSLMGGLTSYIGEDIKCIESDSVKEVGIEVFEYHCWLHGTKPLNEKVSYCKQDQSKTGNGNENGNLYYQWVVLALIFSAICCRIPDWIWTTLEDGLMEVFSDKEKRKAKVWGQDEASIL